MGGIFETIPELENLTYMVSEDVEIVGGRTFRWEE